MRIPSAALTLLLWAGASLAQEPAPVYQKSKGPGVEFHVDVVARQEWTQDIFVSATETKNEDRRLLRALPRLELGGDTFRLGVGGDFEYGSDKNIEPRPTLLRDNYDSRDARLDLAFGRLEPLRWLRLEGGRFVMPVGITEMLWDQDLRPQGGAVTLQHKDANGVSRYGLTGLWARGSHVFDDDRTSMLLISGQVTFPGEGDSSFQVIGSYLGFEDADRLEPLLRRQNTRVLGVIASRYRVADVVVRVKPAGDMPVELVADYCWNTALDDANRGLWLAAVLGSVTTSRAKAGYTYAKVDKDATLAAYTTDDFFWGTGWQGHRVEIGTRTNPHTSIHVIGQLLKFKDSPRPEERDHSVSRLRVEIRTSY